VKIKHGYPDEDYLLRYFAICTLKYLIISKIEFIVTLLRLDELKPGMILAEPVYNQQELLLLEKGTALTKKRIWMLKTWGLEQVYIKGKPGGENKSDNPPGMDTKEAIEKELKEKFADVAGDPVMAEIMKAAGRQLQKNLNDRNEGNDRT
jgi:hypothetical protein